MPDFAAFFASGQVADLMVAVLLAEALALLGFWWLTGRGLRPQSVLALVLPGVFFALALRAALTGAPTPGAKLRQMERTATLATTSAVQRRWAAAVHLLRRRHRRIPSA